LHGVFGQHIVGLLFAGQPQPSGQATI
jgi:hypothetical protein